MHHTFETRLPLFSGYFGTEWNVYDGTTDFFEDESLLTSEDIDRLNDAYSFEFKKYCDTAGPKIVDALLEMQKDTGLIEFKKCEYVKTISPREYNFENDRIEVLVSISGSNLKKMIKGALSYRHLETYLEDNFESRSGFFSFYPSTVYEWEQLWRDLPQLSMDKAFNVFYVLWECYLLANLNTDLNSYGQQYRCTQRQLFNNWSDNFISNTSLSEFVSNEFLNIVDEIREGLTR